MVRISKDAYKDMMNTFIHMADESANREVGT